MNTPDMHPTRRDLDRMAAAQCCDLSDLPTSQCACRIHGPREEASPAGPTFRARFPGQCMECMDDIDIGDYIAESTISGDGGYVHEECK